ncbi:Ig-like domain-containing protein [Promicromonospora panici]|uniref:Ig-like domain-containing protein n=1 Tax=Promicromonospora panici TaxID=2219658 RepID=UPI001F5DA8AF|nr:Ig-like domain-containing protein [Promicromonospora panici]
MSLLSRVSANRRSAASIGAVTLFGAGLVGFALLYEGEATAEVQLNDSGVWVTQVAKGKLGRFNYEAKALDGVLLANSTSFDVEQDAQRVLLDRGSDSSASPVNPALLSLDGTMKFPAGAQVAAGDATTAVYDDETGRTWVLPFDGAVAFDEKKLKPTLKAGTGGELTVSNEGTVFLAVPSQGKLYTVPTGEQGVAEDPEESDLPVEPDAEVRISAVGDEPVVLDQTTGTLVLPGGDTVEIAGAAQGTLQQPSDDADNVVLATPSGLVSQPLGGGTATTRNAPDASGIPSEPVQLGGCTYGAWSESGQVLRDCPDLDNDIEQVLEGVSVGAGLVYRVNRNVIVLNDVNDGKLWMAADEFELVDDWEQTTPQDAEGEKTESEEATPEQVDHVVAQRNKTNRPPEPEPDTFGVRPGRTTVLNVLGNDLDRDGDVMTASVLGEPDGGIGVDRVLDGAALQANVPADATGTTTFDYQVDDGRENGTAEESVRIEVVPLEQNNPPVQSGKPVLRVGQDGLASIKVLPYFKDPDGDDLFLSNASTANNLDEVRSRPDGTIEFRDGGTAVGHKIVDVTVSDSAGLPVEGQLIVDVVASNVPPIPVQDHVTVLAGEPVTVSPLKNDTDPNGDKLRLTRVDGPEPATITTNQTAGTFTFESDEPGSYDVTYEISDGPNPPALGLVRVDVLTRSDAAGAPVAVSDQVLLPTGGTALVDVLANDTDPTGGVLVVQGVTVPPGSPVDVSVLNHQILKVSELKRLSRSVVVEYTVANETGTVTGQVRVVPIPAPAQLRPPEAGPDEATVHAGDVVTIPVLKNDTHPDGLKMTVTDELQESPPASAGEAFVSEETVRFRAGQEAGTFHAVYEVEDSFGQKDSAQVTINVVDAPENSAPQLPDIEARVLSEGIVRIPLPLDGTDPDGDYVTLSSISGAPSKGTAKIVDGFIDYEAGDATGLDSFTYQVMDTRGAPGVGLVRVGVAATPATNQEPQTADDETTVRPGRTVAIAALDNDSDPDGNQIGLVAKGFEGTEDLEPKAVDDDVVVTASGQDGAYSFFYEIQDTFKAKASGAITVNVDQDAPLLRPVAHDDVVTADDVEGSSSVTVNVLANDVDPDGVAADLEVAVDEGLEGVAVTDSRALQVQLREGTRVITYTVRDMDGLEAKAFVRVPGDQSRPHVKPGLEPLKATSGEPLTIDLADYVVVREGREPQITVEDSVKVVDGSVSGTDKDTLVYTSAKDYAGSASVSFEVTDGKGPDDAEGLTSVLTLPIDVTPGENMPPKITGTPVLKVAAGEDALVDLSRYAKDPDKDPLTFVVTGGDGITTEVSGTTITGQVEPSVAKGTSRELPMTVSDGQNPPVQTTLTVEVVASTRSLVQTTQDVVTDAHQGAPTTIPVLRNDVNPFPEEPLKLVGTPTVDTGDGSPVYSGDQLVVTPDEDFTGTMLVRYRVQDATKDPDREMDGIAKLTVLGKPATPRAPRVEEVRSETVVLTWDQPNNNGSDITGYTLRSSGGQEQRCATTTCTFGGLQNNVKYTFTVVATNDVGDSEPSPKSREARPDEKPDKPAAPTLEFGDSELTVTWKNRTYTDRSPIECVNLEISPPPENGVTQKSCVPGSTTVWSGLENGTAYTVRVQAKNKAPDPSDWSDPSAAEVPAAPPAQPAAPTATRENTYAGGQITVTWQAPANNGDAIDKYYLAVFQDGSRVNTIPVSGTSTVVKDLSTDSSYRFTVTAENKAGKSPVSEQSNEEVPFGTPEPLGAPRASLGSNTNGQADVRWDPTADFRGTGGYYKVQASGLDARNAGTASPYTYKGLNNGTSYTFQVQACNEYTCSDWSAPSNAVVPYTVPGTPGIGYHRSDARSGYFTVTGPSSNGGRNVDRIEYRVSGSSSTSGSRTSWPFNINVGNDYDQSFTLQARAHNAAGWSGWSSANGRTDARPAPELWVSSSGVSAGCEFERCEYWVIHWKNMGPGNHQVACWAGDTSNNGGPREWHDIRSHATTWAGSSTKTTVSGDSGSKQVGCYMGGSYNGTAVGVKTPDNLYKGSTWNIG